MTWSCCSYPSFCLLSLFSLSVMSDSLPPHRLQQAGFPVFHHLLKFAQTHICWVSDAIQPSDPLLPPSPPAFSLASIRVFSNQLALDIRWPNYWSFSFSISPYNEYSGLISFKIDWFELLESKRLSRVFSSNTVWKHKFFTAWPSLWSNSHIHTWLWEKSHMDLCQQLIPLLFNTLSRFLIAFLPRSMYLLISWLQSPSAVILEPKKIKSVTVSIFPHLFAIKWWCQMSWS